MQTTHFDVERHLDELRKLLDWVILDGVDRERKPAEVVRRARYVYFLFSFADRDRRRCEFSKRHGESPQQVHKLAVDFARTFNVPLQGGRLTRRRRVPFYRADEFASSHADPPEESID